MNNILISVFWTRQLNYPGIQKIKAYANMVPLALIKSEGFDIITLLFVFNFQFSGNTVLDSGKMAH